jgi:DNA modification methylase
MIDEFFVEDCLVTMGRMPDGFVDLVVTSPPYDNLRTYNGYSFDFEAVARELFRVVKPGGVVVWVVGDQTVDGSETGSSFRQALGFMDVGFRLHDTMIWRKTNPMPKVKTKRYFDCFEYMFVFSKGQPKSFNPLMQATKFGGQVYDSTVKRITTGKERVGKSFVLNSERFRDNIWDVAIAQNKTSHPAVFPLQLAVDHVLSWSVEGDLVFDPFVGSGTTALAAKQCERFFVGCDVSFEYVEVAKNRLEREIGLWI